MQIVLSLLHGSVRKECGGREGEGWETREKGRKRRIGKKREGLKRKREEKVSTSDVVTFSHNSSQTKHKSSEFHPTLSPPSVTLCHCI